MKCLRLFTCAIIALSLLPTNTLGQGVTDRTFGPLQNGQVESSVAVNPANLDHVALSFMVSSGAVGVYLPCYFSTDGGNTWFDGNSPLALNNNGDPVVAFSTNGCAYHASLGPLHTIQIASTTDFGMTWRSTTSVDPGQGYNDKPHIAADVSGIWPQNVYAAWMTGQNGGPIVVSRSTNEGVAWTDGHVLAIQGDARGQGAHISIGPNGEVYIVWAEYVESSLAETGIGFAKSTNGGVTYSNPSSILDVSGIRQENDQGIPQLNNTRAASFPYMDVDRSNGQRRGWIYVVYPALAGGQADIFLDRSSDGGSSWGGHVRVNGDDVQSGKWQWMSSVAVDPFNGEIFVSYYSMDQVGQNFLTNRYLANSTDGGQSFSRMIVSDGTFNWQGNQGGTFAGDYYETAAYQGRVWTTWSIPDPNSGPMSIRLELPGTPVSLSVQQQLEGSGTSFGNVGRWIGLTFDNNLQTPWARTTYSGVHEALRSEQEIVSLQKYNNWNGLNDVSNHHSFDINQSVLLIANFRPTQSDIKVKTDFLDAPGITGGSIQFRDPWYIDLSDPQYGNNRWNRGMAEAEWWTRQSLPPDGFKPDYTYPYPEGPYRGVFLNQVPDPNDPNKPYYSVGVPDPNPINGLTTYFLGWTGNYVSYQYPNNLQTPVVFLSGGPPTAIARYKAHLGSSVANATGSNSQRVVAGISAYQAPDIYYMAYPSAGELWWSSSDDAGGYWWYDWKFTNSSGTASAPSVALWREQLDPPIMHLFTAYRQQVGNNHQIRFTDALKTPIASETISQVNIPTGIDTRPVIALFDIQGSKILQAFWQGIYGIHYNYAEQNGSSWEWLGEDYGGLAANTRNPSISSPDLTIHTPNWYLTYDNGNNVLMSDYSGTFYDTSIPASITPISYSSQVCADNRDGEQVHVVWEAYGDDEVERRYVMYQQWSGTRWEDAHVFTSGIDYYRPTVSSLSNGDIVWAWDDGANTYKAVHTIDDDNWSVVEFLSNTTQPNLVGSASEGPIGSTRFVSTSTLGAPYRLTFGAETTDGPQSLTLQEQYSRRVVVARKPPQRPGRFRHSMSSDEQYDGDSLCYVSVELLPITLKMRDGSVVPMEFVSVGDSTRDERSIWESLRTRPMTLTSGIDSIIIAGETDALSPHRLAGVELGLSFDLVDADHGTELKRIGTERIFSSSGRGSLVRREGLSGVAGHRVFLRPSIRGFVGRSASLVSTIVHVHTLLLDSTSNPASPLAKTGEAPAALPTEFALHQNYPNPFNPTTEIRFDLPDAGNVSLVVFDVLGREVATLASEYREAGYHSARWNASNQASGVYFARFSVINAQGKMAYSKVNKLMLIR
jgi:hypothetical protein